jgi:hypothetical protein
MNRTTETFQLSSVVIVSDFRNHNGVDKVFLGEQFPFNYFT